VGKPSQITQEHLDAVPGLRERGLNWAEAAAILGVTSEALKTAWFRKRKWLGRKKTALTPQAAPRDASVLLRCLRPKPTPVTTLAWNLKASVEEVQGWLTELRERGYRVRSAGDKCWLDRDVVPEDVEVSHRRAGVRRRIGIVSDTHLGSRHQQLTHLNDFYDRCALTKVTDVYHAGDLLAGVGVYPGQHSDLFVHTEDDQVDYAVANYPRREGVRTHVIGGNHDLAFVKQGGADPVRLIAKERDDIEYLGAYAAWVDLAPGCLMYLLHTDGAAPYAQSYRLQKLIESFQGGRKPNIAVVGHLHSWTMLFLRNVYGMLAGCFEAQSDYLRRKALQPQIGGTILDIEFTDGGAIQRFRPEFVAYLVAKDRDW